MRLHRVCFTGHRPEKMIQPGYVINQLLEEAIYQSIKEGFTTFISGMARGVAIWAAEIVLRLKKEGYPIHLICASPYPGFESHWAEDWRLRYQRVMKEADLVRYICKNYHRRCFQTRNEWMVKHSAKVIAVFNGEKGGTKNTIDYALHNGVIVHNVLR